LEQLFHFSEEGRVVVPGSETIEARSLSRLSRRRFEYGFTADRAPAALLGCFPVDEGLGLVGYERCQDAPEIVTPLQVGVAFGPYGLAEVVERAERDVVLVRRRLPAQRGQLGARQPGQPPEEAV